MAKKWSLIFFVILVVLISADIILGPKFFRKPSLPNTKELQHRVEQAARHQRFHYWVIDGQKLEPVPYLTLPFKEAELQAKPLRPGVPYEVAEGWMYDEQELKISHADPLHAAIDLQVRYGTTIYSPVDGYATSSYHTFWLKNDDGTKKLYEGKPIRMGLGYFIYIYDPQVKRFVELAHLSDIDPSIPFQPPQFQNDEWVPPTRAININEFINSPNVVFIKSGQRLGTVGYSGLGWGEEFDEYVAGANRPIVVDPATHKSWDEPHVHFEEFWIDQTTGEKGWQRDPYAIYDTYQYYPGPHKKLPMGKDPLFLLNKDGTPQFAL